LSLGLLLTLLAVAEARVINTKITRNNMISDFSIRGFPFDIVYSLKELSAWDV